MQDLICDFVLRSWFMWRKKKTCVNLSNQEKYSTCIKLRRKLRGKLTLKGDDLFQLLLISLGFKFPELVRRAGFEGRQQVQWPRAHQPKGPKPKNNLPIISYVITDT